MGYFSASRAGGNSTYSTKHTQHIAAAVYDAHIVYSTFNKAWTFALVISLHGHGTFVLILWVDGEKINTDDAWSDDLREWQQNDNS